MKIRQLLVLAGMLWALQLIYFLAARSWLGFPDGSLTELARARKRLYPVLSAACAVAALTCWALAAVSRAGTSKAAKAALWALPVASALLWGIDRYLAASLDDGGGG